MSRSSDCVVLFNTRSSCTLPSDVASHRGESVLLQVLVLHLNYLAPAAVTCRTWSCQAVTFLALNVRFPDLCRSNIVSSLSVLEIEFQQQPKPLQPHATRSKKMYASRRSWIDVASYLYFV